MHKLMTLLLLAAIALSGCASEEPTTDDPVDTGSDGSDGMDGGDDADGTDDADGSDGSDATENETNTAPEVSLVASAVNGTAPLNVTFTLDGSDVDGDDLAWTFSLEDDAVESGSSLPATTALSFETAGDYNVTLSVTDGEEWAQQTLTITVEEAALLPTYAETFEAEVTLPCMVCQEIGAGASIAWNSGEGGVDSVQFALPAEAAGREFTTSESSDLDSDIEFFASCASDAASLGLYTSVDAHEAGTVPEGAGCAVLWVWYPVGPVTVTLDVF